MLNLLDFELKRYIKIREMACPLLTEVGKTIPRDLIGRTARDSGMLEGDGRTLVLDNEEHVNFLVDRALHDIPWSTGRAQGEPKQRWIERVCDEKIHEYSPEQQAYLRAHRDAVFSLYEIWKVDSVRGVHLRDVFNGGELFLMDTGLGLSGQEGHVLATRIIAYEGLNFTAGVAMVFAPEEKQFLIDFLNGRLARDVGTISREVSMRRDTPLLFEIFKGSDIDYKTVYVSEKLRQGARESKGPYERALAANESAPEFSGMPKVGRNEPCPCGSGKKYKKCCLDKMEDHEPTFRETVSSLHKQKLIEDCDRFPIDQCLINADWKQHQLARITVTRRQPNDCILFGGFLVDLGCLGIKDAFCDAELPPDYLEAGMASTLYGEEPPTSIGILYAKEIIQGALDYARRLGFEPHEDFELVRHVLGSEEPPMLHEIQFGGPNDKPLYVAGPHDDADKIIRHLTDRLGQDGFDFIMPMDLVH